MDFSRPHPSVVTAQSVARLPRWVLALFCAAWVLPGVIGRDVWRADDVTSYALMLAMAEGRTSWWTPTLGGLPVDVVLLPHWLGALSIQLLKPWVDATLAIRIPFGLMLLGTLLLVWSAAYHLARLPAAQPLPLAFGGDAKQGDYSTALADGATLALIATLGLLDLGHQASPELTQLFSVSLLLWALSMAPLYLKWGAGLAIVALVLMAGGGAPAMALMLALLLSIFWGRSRRESPLVVRWFLVAGAALGALTGTGLQTWSWQFASSLDMTRVGSLLRLWSWFLWPVWPLALWTIWQWRRQLGSHHLLLPLVIAITSLLASIGMSQSDRGLLLGLPGMAILACFALPTLKRTFSAAIDWFSMCLFSATALFIWVMYVAMQTGYPEKPAANVARLAPGFEAPFSVTTLAVALCATSGWLMLVRWRTSRHRPALWKSMVLPAGGVTLCWLLLMSLWLPLIDYDRSPKWLVDPLRAHVKPGECIDAPELPMHWIAALEALGPFETNARPLSERRCPLLLAATLQGKLPAVAQGTAVTTVTRPTVRREQVSLHRRDQPPSQGVAPPVAPAPPPPPRP